jgi:hypothetical protein
MVSKAGDLRRRRRNREAQVLDSGRASSLMRLAAWANVQGEKENDNEVERRRESAVAWSTRKSRSATAPTSSIVPATASW